MSPPCIILAGGLGTRLQSAVPNFPKCLAPIAGRPFLEWQLRSLAVRGVNHFVLALGHAAEQVVESLALPWARSFSIATVIEKQPKGTGGATLHAMDEVGLDEALVVNGDSFLAGSLRAMLTPLDLVGGEYMRIATVNVPDRARFGGVAVDNAHRVTTFLEKGQISPGQISAGIYRINRCTFGTEDKDLFSMETQVMPRLVTQGNLQARELSGPFIDIGIPNDYHYFDAHVHDFIRDT